MTSPDEWPVEDTEEDPIDDPDDEGAGEPDEYIEQSENAADNDESDP